MKKVAAYLFIFVLIIVFLSQSCAKPNKDAKLLLGIWEGSLVGQMGEEAGGGLIYRFTFKSDGTYDQTVSWMGGSTVRPNNRYWFNGPQLVFERTYIMIYNMYSGIEETEFGLQEITSRNFTPDGKTLYMKFDGIGLGFRLSRIQADKRAGKKHREKAKATFVKSKDSKRYRTVKMPDGKVWLAENLNHRTTNSWCYDDNNANCDTYGRLYTWDDAMVACETLGRGWRLPDTMDWNNLESAVGGWSNAGTMLKSNTGWDDGGNGINEFGFSALPGGLRSMDGRFIRAGSLGDWWTATEMIEDSDIFTYGLGSGTKDGIAKDGMGASTIIDKRWGLSVRCVQDVSMLGASPPNSQTPIQQTRNTAYATPGRFPQASEQLLTVSDLQSYSKNNLRLMRNEIFARHGYIFQTDDMSAYFRSQNWYIPKYNDVNSMLTNIERQNVELIRRYE